MDNMDIPVGNLTDRELLLLTLQKVGELTRDMKEMKKDIHTTFATKAELAAVAEQITHLSSKNELEILRTELKPYLNTWAQVAKISIGAATAGALALLGIKSVS